MNRNTQTNIHRIILLASTFLIFSAAVGRFIMPWTGTWAMTKFLVMNIVIISIAWRLTSLIGSAYSWESQVLDVGVVTLALIVIIEIIRGTLRWLQIDTLVLVVGLISLVIWNLPFKQHVHLSEDQLSGPGTEFSFKPWWACGQRSGVARGHARQTQGAPHESSQTSTLLGIPA